MEAFIKIGLLQSAFDHKTSSEIRCFYLGGRDHLNDIALERLSAFIQQYISEAIFTFCLSIDA